MLMGPSPQINCFCSSGSDLLKHTTKEFSVNHCLNQQLVLGNRHRQGILAGCTLSIILFLAGMNIILEYSMQAMVPKFTTNNTTLPLLRAFMDELSLMSCKVSGAQTLLSRCITDLSWAGPEFRAY